VTSGFTTVVVVVVVVAVVVVVTVSVVVLIVLELSLVVAVIHDQWIHRCLLLHLLCPFLRYKAGD